MPRGDRTGPAGFGPMTGRGLGYCAGYGQPGFMAPGFGGGRGWGRGWGRGYGRGFGWGRFGGYGPYYEPYPPYSQPYYQPTKKEEKEMLEDDVTDLEEELKAIKARLSELKGQK